MMALALALANAVAKALWVVSVANLTCWDGESGKTGSEVGACISS
jgi:hypothetical protein